MIHICVYVTKYALSANLKDLMSLLKSMNIYIPATYRLLE